MAGARARARRVVSASHDLRPDWLRNADRIRNPDQWLEEHQVSVFLGRMRPGAAKLSLVSNRTAITDLVGLNPSAVPVGDSYVGLDERLSLAESIAAIRAALIRHREMFGLAGLLDSEGEIAGMIQDEVEALFRTLAPRTAATLLDEVYRLDRRAFDRLSDEEKASLFTVAVESNSYPAWRFTVQLCHEKRRRMESGESPFTDPHQAFTDALHRSLPAGLRDNALIFSSMEVSDAASRRDPSRPVGLHFHGVVALPCRQVSERDRLEPSVRHALWTAGGYPKGRRGNPKMLELRPWDHPDPQGWGLYSTKGTKCPDPRLLGKDLVKMSRSAVALARSFHATVVQSWARALRRASFALERSTRSQEALGAIELGQLNLEA
jgi:hypothetical protein